MPPARLPKPCQTTLLHCSQLVAVDILTVVQKSPHSNQYILVFQDYFSKWPFTAQAIPDQKVERIVKNQVFTVVWPPCKLHSKAAILFNLYKAFKVTKSHTTPRHPMGDGLVERINCISCMHLPRRVGTGRTTYNYQCICVLNLKIHIYRHVLLWNYFWLQSTIHTCSKVVHHCNLRSPELTCVRNCWTSGSSSMLTSGGSRGGAQGARAPPPLKKCI